MKYPFKHGLSYTSEYGIWNAMKTRCLNPNFKFYSYYGGRGITICPTWLESFKTFYLDMGPKPSKRHSLDRIDNTKGYSKENCRWATRKEQMRNTSANLFIEYDGQTKSLDEWAVITGLKCATLYARIYGMKWTVKDAITRPHRYKSQRKEIK